MGVHRMGRATGWGGPLVCLVPRGGRIGGPRICLVPRDLQFQGTIGWGGPATHLLGKAAGVPLLKAVGPASRPTWPGNDGRRSKCCWGEGCGAQSSHGSAARHTAVSLLLATQPTHCCWPHSRFAAAGHTADSQLARKLPRQGNVGLPCEADGTCEECQEHSAQLTTFPALVLPWYCS